jgi:hypothetical protein
MKKFIRAGVQIIFGMSLSFFNAGCSILGIRSEESPSYEVLQKEGSFEIRKYSSYIVAKTKVQGDYKDAQSRGFRTLAKYIFGGNKGNQSISMTAPVAVGSSKTEEKSEKIAMTAPVTQIKSGNEWTITFMMPSKYNLQTLPTPNDPNITLEVVDPKTYGVIIFSGFWSTEKNLKQGEKLKEWLNSKPQWRPVGEVIFAGYNPPWTIPFFRHNEVLIELEAL